MDQTVTFEEASQKVKVEWQEDEDLDCVTSWATRRRKGKRFHWKKEQEEDLVEWWRENDALYDLSQAGFHDREKKEQLFTEKAEQVGCSADDVKLHIRSLRTKLNHIMKKASSTETKRLTYREKWVFDRLEFIRPFITARRRTKASSKIKNNSTTLNSSDSDAEAGPMSDDNEDSADIPLAHSVEADPQICLPVSVFTPLSPSSLKHIPDFNTGEQHPAKRRRPSSPESEELTLLREIAKVVSSPTLPPQEEENKKHNIDSFLQHLRSVLWNMPEADRMDLQGQIIANVYKRNRELRMSCQPRASLNHGTTS